jgi:hypothetical protein
MLEAESAKVEVSRESVLQTLPPEAMWVVKRCARDKEGRGRSDLGEHGRRDLDMAREVVVEGDGDGERLSALAFAYSRCELRAHDKAVVGCEMIHLFGEERRRERRNQLPPRIARRLTDPVVHECDPEPAAGEAGSSLENSCNANAGHAEKPSAAARPHRAGDTFSEGEQ